MNNMKLLLITMQMLTIMVLIVSCSSSTYSYDLDIRNKYWKLIEMGGDTVIVYEAQREPHIIFKLNEENVTGSGGCNNFIGSYKINGDSVKIGPLAITRKFCDSIMDQETKFMRILEEADKFKVYSETLEMISDKIIIAKFKAIYFK